MVEEENLFEPSTLALPDGFLLCKKSYELAKMIPVIRSKKTDLIFFFILTEKNRFGRVEKEIMIPKTI